MKYLTSRLCGVLAAGLLLGSLVTGCNTISDDYASLKGAYNTLTGATVSIDAVVIAVNAFDAVEVTATNYLSLRRCTGSNGPVCRDPGATKQIAAAVRSGRVARNNIKQFMRDHPGQLGQKGLYDVLTSATATLRDVVARYKAG